MMFFSMTCSYVCVFFNDIYDFVCFFLVILPTLHDLICEISCGLCDAQAVKWLVAACGSLGKLLDARA